VYLLEFHEELLKYKPEDCQIALNLISGSFKKRLAGGILPPPPYLSWLVWSLSFQAKYSGTGTLDYSKLFDSAMQIMLSVSSEGDAGFYFDIGAFYTMAKDLGSLITGGKDEDKTAIKNIVSSSADAALHKNGTSNNAKAPDSPFLDAIEKLFSFVDLKMSAAIRLVYRGEISIEMFLKRIKNKDWSWLQIPEDKSPNFKLYLEMPVTGTVSVVTKQIANITCDLVSLTRSSLKIFPSGIKAEMIGNKGANWSDVLRPISFQFIKFKTSDFIYHDDENPSYQLGDFFKCKVYANANNADEFGKDFQLSLEIPNEGLSIDFKTEEKWVSGNYFVEYESLSFNYLVELNSTIDVYSLARSESSNKNIFLKSLLNKQMNVYIRSTYGSDSGYISEFSHNKMLTLQSPYITVNSQSDKNTSIKEELVINFTVKNLKLPKGVALYCRIYEQNLNLHFFQLKRKGINEKGIVALNKGNNQFQLKIPFPEMGEIRPGWTNIDTDLDAYWEICFDVSLDKEGSYKLKFDKGLNSNWKSKEFKIRKK